MSTIFFIRFHFHFRFHYLYLHSRGGEGVRFRLGGDGDALGADGVELPRPILKNCDRGRETLSRLRNICVYYDFTLLSNLVNLLILGHIFYTF